MVKASDKIGVIIPVVALLTLFLLAACSSGEDERSFSLAESTVTPSAAQTPAVLSPSISPGNPVLPEFTASSGTIVITIGNLTDLTGPGAHAMSYATMALEDMVRYYNDEHLIPGVELKTATYDGQLDPSRDIPGYEWLKREGANLIFSPVPSAAVILKPRLEEDGIVMFALAPTEQSLAPPGYVFSPSNILCKPQSYTLLKWIAENDPDFPQDRPAKIGGAFWAESYGASILAGAKEYARDYPDQYDWEGSHLTDFITFNWQAEVEKLRDCDYVIPPAPMTQFVKQYRDAGYTAKFIGYDAHLGFLGMVDAAGIWDEVDGMLFIKPGLWWNEEGEMINLCEELIHRYHSDKAEEIMGAGVGYQAAHGVYLMLELIADAVKAVGSEGFNSQAVYDAVQEFSIEVDGCEYNFSETKRVATNCLAVYELQAAEKDVFKVDTEWIPAVASP